MYLVPVVYELMLIIVPSQVNVFASVDGHMADGQVRTSSKVARGGHRDPLVRKLQQHLVLLLTLNHGINPPSTQSAQTPLLIQNCQTSQKNNFLFTDIKDALVWCQVVQK